MYHAHAPTSPTHMHPASPHTCTHLHTQTPEERRQQQQEEGELRASKRPTPSDRDSGDGNPALRKRNARMFGALMGTLRKFKYVRVLVWAWVYVRGWVGLGMMGGVYGWCTHGVQPKCMLVELFHLCDLAFYNTLYNIPLQHPFTHYTHTLCTLHTIHTLYTHTHTHTHTLHNYTHTTHRLTRTLYSRTLHPLHPHNHRDDELQRKDSKAQQLRQEALQRAKAKAKEQTAELRQRERQQQLQARWERVFGGGGCRERGRVCRGRVCV